MSESPLLPSSQYVLAAASHDNVLDLSIRIDKPECIALGIRVMNPSSSEITADFTNRHNAACLETLDGGLEPLNQETHANRLLRWRLLVRRRSSSAPDFKERSHTNIKYVAAVMSLDKCQANTIFIKGGEANKVMSL